MKNAIFIILISTLIVAQVPENFDLLRNVNDDAGFTMDEHHNSIRHIRKYDDKLYLATSSGLGYLDISELSSPIYYNINNTNLPDGGIPALKIYETNNELIILLSGITSSYESADDKYHHRGTGISWSLDSGNSWYYSPQPVDNGEIGGDTLITWYGKTFSKKVWHTTVDNASYDVAADLQKQYIYAPLWGAGLKRLNYSDDLSEWEVIPLPLDNQDSLMCNEPFPSNYNYNPSTDGSGSFNHGVFSVFIDNNIIWVGTAGGINKGLINEDNCIDWHHYNDENGLASNWVIGIYPQLINSITRIWAITWKGYRIPHSLSYTDDSGKTWNQVNQFEDLGLIVYNLYTDDAYELLASTSNGLYKADPDNPNFWYKIEIGTDSQTGEQLISGHLHGLTQDKVLSSIGFNSGEVLVVGSSDGLALTSDSGNTWNIIRSWQQSEALLWYQKEENVGAIVDPAGFSVYPNPLYKNQNSKTYYSNGTVRFIYSNINQLPSSVDIYDFTMNHIVHLDNTIQVGNESEVIWNATNSYNKDVSNGVYFCRLNLDDKNYWTKLLVIN